jgi:hypothetical protein
MSGAATIANRAVPLSACSPHPGNYNRHDEGQVADLRTSLKRFGQVRSIVVQDDGAGGYLLVAGHGVAEAARLEGLAELRADVIPADWTPARVLAYLAADNELARRGLPDEAQLAALVQQVQAEADEELARLAAGGEEELRALLAALPIVDDGEFADKHQRYHLQDDRIVVGFGRFAAPIESDRAGDAIRAIKERWGEDPETALLEVCLYLVNENSSG